MKNKYNKSEINIQKDNKYKKPKKSKQKINGGDPEPDLVPEPDLYPKPDIKVGDHIEVTIENFERDYQLWKEENGKKYYKKRDDKNSKYLYLLEYDFYEDNNPIFVDLPKDDPYKEQRLELGNDKVRKIKQNLNLSSMKSALRVFMEHCSRTIIDENGKVVNVCDKSIEPLIDGNGDTYTQDVQYVKQQGPYQGPQQQPVQYAQYAQYVQQPQQQGQYVQLQPIQYGREDIGDGTSGISQSLLNNNYYTPQRPRPQYATQQLPRPQYATPQPGVDMSLYTAPMRLQPEDMTQNTAPLQMQPTIYTQQRQSPHPVPGSPSPATLTQPCDQQIHPLRSFYPVRMDLPPPTNYDDTMVGGGKIKNKSKLLFRDLLNDPNSKYVKYMNTLYLKINNQLLSVNKLYEFINSKDVRVKKEVKSKK